MLHCAKPLRKSEYGPVLFSKRAAGGESAAEQAGAEWTSEGKRKRERSPEVCATEQGSP